MLLSNNRNWIVIIISSLIGLTGDFFYLGAIFFRTFMVKTIIAFAPYKSTSNLSPFAQDAILFLTATIGAMLYLIAFLIYALWQPGNNQKYIVLIGIILWFITDCLSSIIFGFIYNAVFNIIFLLFGLNLFWNMKKEK